LVPAAAVPAVRLGLRHPPNGLSLVDKPIARVFFHGCLPVGEARPVGEFTQPRVHIPVRLLVLGELVVMVGHGLPPSAAEKADDEKDEQDDERQFDDAHYRFPVRARMRTTTAAATSAQTS